MTTTYRYLFADLLTNIVIGELPLTGGGGGGGAGANAGGAGGSGYATVTYWS